MNEMMIELSEIRKTFRVAQREQGPLAAARSLFHRQYQEIRALDGLTFSIEKGETVGYIGPNGAGKSTSIKVMSGVLVPDGGSCRVMGMCPWDDRKRYVRRIGVVFGQRTQLWWDVPLLDSYDLLKRIYSIPDTDYKVRLGRLTEVLGLSAFLKTPLRQVSLGQRMRAELAASLLHNPDVLFLDEPTIGLDAVSKLSVRAFLKSLSDEKETTVILTTHDMQDIEALCARILFIGKGRILFDGTLQTLRDTYPARSMEETVAKLYQAHGMADIRLSPQAEGEP